MYQLFLGLISTSLMATTFIPISIERQIKDSDSILQGRFVNSFSKKLSNGTIVTENSFDVLSSQGIKKSELRAFVHFKVLTPGGTWQNDTFKVEGSPRFKKDEEVLLFLKKDDNGYWVQNLSLGKYKVKKIGSENLIISNVFPYHPQMGQMPLAELYKKIEEIKGEKIAEYVGNFSNDNQYLELTAIKDKKLRSKIRRGFASQVDKENIYKEKNREPSNEENELSIWWLIFFLALMGGFSSFIIRRV